MTPVFTVRQIMLFLHIRNFNRHETYKIHIIIPARHSYKHYGSYGTTKQTIGIQLYSVMPAMNSDAEDR